MLRSSGLFTGDETAGASNSTLLFKTMRTRQEAFEFVSACHGMIRGLAAH